MLSILIGISHIYAASFGVDFNTNMHATRMTNTTPSTYTYNGKSQIPTNISIHNNTLSITKNVSPSILYRINDLIELTDEQISKKYGLVVKDNQFSINGLETKLYKSNIIGLYLSLHKEIVRCNNTLYISKRDYMRDELVQAMQNIRDNSTKIVPESLCVVAYEMLSVNDKSVNFVVFNSRGTKMCVTCFECKDEAGVKSIKKMYYEEIGEGDYFYDEIVRKFVEEKFENIFEETKENETLKFFNGKIKILPALVDDSDKDEYYYLDATQILKDTKSSALNNDMKHTHYNIEFKNSKGQVAPVQFFKAEINDLREKITKEHTAYDLTKLDEFLKDKEYSVIHLGDFGKKHVPEKYQTDKHVEKDCVAFGAACLTNNEKYVIEDDRNINVKCRTHSEEKTRQKQLAEELAVYEEFNKLNEEDFVLTYITDSNELVNSWKVANTFDQKKTLMEELTEAKKTNRKIKFQHDNRPKAVKDLKTAINDTQKKLSEIGDEESRKNVEQEIAVAENFYNENFEDEKVLYEPFVETRKKMLQAYNKAVVRKKLIAQQKERDEKEAARKALLEEAKEKEKTDEKDDKAPKADKGAFEKMLKDAMPNFDPKEYEKMIGGQQFDFEKYAKMFGGGDFNSDAFKKIYNQQPKSEMPEEASDGTDEDKTSQEKDVPVTENVSDTDLKQGEDILNESLPVDTTKDLNNESLTNEDL